MLKSIDVVNNPKTEMDKYNYEINLKQDPQLRVKMGAYKKGQDPALIPEDISEDHWGEINNYQY